MAARTIEAVVGDYTERLMAVRGVVGTGIGERDGLPCIRVFVESATAELTQRIPAWLRGVPCRGRRDRLDPPASSVPRTLHIGDATGERVWNLFAGFTQIPRDPPRLLWILALGAFPLWLNDER